MDILQQYVSAIRALRAIDPSWGLADAIGAPVQGYLRGRRDAIRCIVSSLTHSEGEGEDGGGGLSLAEELARSSDGKVRARLPAASCGAFSRLPVFPRLEGTRWVIYGPGRNVLIREGSCRIEKRCCM